MEKGFFLGWGGSVYTLNNEIDKCFTIFEELSPTVDNFLKRVSLA